MAAKVKFTAEVREVYLRALREGNGRYAAARIAGITWQTVARYVGKNPQFEDEMTASIKEGLNAVRMNLHNEALSPGNGRLALDMLTRSKYVDEFSNKQEVDANNTNTTKIIYEMEYIRTDASKAESKTS